MAAARAQGSAFVVVRTDHAITPSPVLPTGPPGQGGGRRVTPRPVLFQCLAHDPVEVAHACHQRPRLGGELGGRPEVVADAIAQRLGYLHMTAGVQIRDSDVGNYPAQDVLCLSTGSQGEPMSALSRIAIDGTPNEPDSMVAPTVPDTDTPSPRFSP